ncbi:Chymotrypsin-like protease CTRL-1 like protein [Argiope bruennichi]|uniref:Chymotrypsin-like protease CTRL-1 like protein n=1 Tax=Argiope bruennichi TaxID=94029 RepID=A0A8T0FM11_ARGBR|nr:Chymotrypsin-like protease CTRL-1 like protein [Argiope bruennichi]
MYEPIKKVPFTSSIESELPVVVDSLSKKDKPVKVEPSTSYSMYEPIKKVPFTSSIESELPVVVDSLSKKDKPVKVEPSTSYSTFTSSIESELPVVVDSLSKKDKPMKVEPSTSYSMYEPIKKVPFTSSIESELPVVVDSLSKKDKPVKVEPSTSYSMYEPIKKVPFTSSIESELPVVVDSLSKKDKPVKVEPSTSYSMYEPIKKVPFTSATKSELPVVVDYLKDKSVIVEPAASYMYKSVKAKPFKDGNVVIDAPNYSVGFDSFYKLKEPEHEAPVVVEALVRREKPTFQVENFERPVVVEALVRREKPTFQVENFERPVVIEALVRRNPTYENKRIKEDEVLPRNLPQPIKESILSTDNENFNIPVIEALTFEEGIDSNKNSKQESITFGETHGFNDSDMDNMDENGDDGSAIGFDKSRFARSLPVNSDVFSILTNVKEKEKFKFKSCVTPKNETGNCMPIQQCSVSSIISNIDELLRNVCLVDEVFIGVCCPEFPVETVRVDWEELKPNKAILNEKKSSQILKECGRLPLMVTNRDPWPWMASLIAKSSDKIFCGGALIQEQYVLTAAHCTIRIPRNQILVRLGRPASENRSEPDFEVIEIKRHAGYNPRTMQNDIALLKLSRPVQLGDFRRVVCLSEENESKEGLVNESASLLRWKETPGEIKDVEPLLVISPRECQSRMRTAISDSILCTEPRTDETMCNADSGAPLIIAKDDKFEVIGILTWNRNDCDERFPTVFTRISSYRRWIEKLAS